MSSAMPQHYYSPHRDHQTQHAEKCSVHTRRCSALQRTLIFWSSSSFCSTGLSVTSPHIQKCFHSSSWFQNNLCCLLKFLYVFSGTFATLHHSASPNTSLRALSFQSSALIAPVFLEVTHFSLHLTSPSGFSPPCLIASLASCPEYLILHSRTVSPLPLQHYFCYSVIQPFSIGAFIDFSCCFLFCN